MAQGRRLKSDAVARKFVLLGGDLGKSFDDIVGVALRIDAARHGEAHEIHWRGMLRAVRSAPEHHRADLARAHAADLVERAGERLPWILKRGNVAKPRARV